MARPIFVWRLDELQPKHTIRESANGAELKIQTDGYRIWLNFGVVEVEEKQENCTGCSSRMTPRSDQESVTFRVPPSM